MRRRTIWRWRLSVALWFALTLTVGAILERTLYGLQLGLPDTLDVSSRQGDSLAIPTDGREIRQSMTIDVPRLDALCLDISTNRATPGRFVLEARARADHAQGPRLWREVVEVARSGVICRPFALPHGLSVAAPGQLWIVVRATAAHESEGLALRTTATKVLGNEQLILDHERWADLRIAVTSAAATRAARGLWPDWMPPALSSRPRLAIALAASLWSSVALLALGMLPWPTRRRRLGRRYAAVVMAAAGVLAVAMAPAHEAPGSAGLLDELAAARLSTNAPRLGQAFALTQVDLGDGQVRALVALPRSSVEWSLRLSGREILTTAVALRQEAWNQPGDGATFEVLLRLADGRVRSVYRRHLDPFADASVRGWQEVRVRLSSDEGQVTGVILSTEAGPHDNAVLDAALWRNPAIAPQ